MKKILIVEDDTILNKTLSYNLVSEGYETASAYSCAMARDLLKGCFHLALLDVNLPDGNGLTLCGEIRKRWPETYIIFLTGKAICCGAMKPAARIISPSLFPWRCCAKRSPPYLKP